VELLQAQVEILATPFSPMNSTQFRSSRTFRQKQIPSSQYFFKMSRKLIADAKRQEAGMKR
jgi:hypothetical protein